MLWRSFKKIFTYEIILILLFIFFYIICRCFNITCLVYEITKIPCPTCKMGRALIFLLKGDVKQYIQCNVMALPVAVVFVCELFITHFGKYKRAVHIFSVIILAINMLYYLIRINSIF